MNKIINAPRRGGEINKSANARVRHGKEEDTDLPSLAGVLNVSDVGKIVSIAAGKVSLDGSEIEGSYDWSGDAPPRDLPAVKIMKVIGSYGGAITCEGGTIFLNPGKPREAPTGDGDGNPAAKPSKAYKLPWLDEKKAHKLTQAALSVANATITKQEEELATLRSAAPPGSQGSAPPGSQGSIGSQTQLVSIEANLTKMLNHMTPAEAKKIAAKVTGEPQDPSKEINVLRLVAYVFK